MFSAYFKLLYHLHSLTPWWIKGLIFTNFKVCFICYKCSTDTFEGISFAWNIFFHPFIFSPQGGDPKETGIISGGQAPCSTGSPCLVSLLGTHLYQCTSWWCCERLNSASVNCFWRLKTRLLTSWRVIYKPTVQSVLSVQHFLTKNSMAPMPHPPHSPDLTPSNFLFPWIKKALTGKCSADVKEVKQKTAEALELRGIKIHELKNCFEQWKKVLISVLHQMESDLKVTKVWTCKSKYTIFY